MKNAVILLVSGVVGSLLLAMVMTICGNMNRRVDLQANLSTAVESSVRKLVSENQRWSEEEMLAACIGNIAVAVDSDMDITVDVYQMDAQKGIMAVETVGEYKHPNGMEGSVRWQRTAIYERQKEAEQMGACNVSFYRSKEDMLSEEDCYKRYCVRAGEHIREPVQPKKTGLRFAGWKDYNDYMADFSQPVIQNLCYYAAWE